MIWIGYDPTIGATVLIRNREKIELLDLETNESILNLVTQLRDSGFTIPKTFLGLEMCDGVITHVNGNARNWSTMYNSSKPERRDDF